MSLETTPTALSPQSVLSLQSVLFAQPIRRGTQARLNSNRSQVSRPHVRGDKNRVATFLRRIFLVRLASVPIVLHTGV